jgi:hypothetical protein
MSRQRDHRVRLDASQCPDPDGCARLFHGALRAGLSVGDICECCGHMIQPAAEWEAVPDPYDRRRVVYWRLVRAGIYLGAVSRKPGGWRALTYGPDGRLGKAHEGRASLGIFHSRRAAERAVEDARP